MDAVVSFYELNNFPMLHVKRLITADLFFQFLENSSAIFNFPSQYAASVDADFFCKLLNFPKRCMRSSSCISLSPPLMSARGIAAVSALSGTGAGIQRNCCGHFFLCFSFVCFFCTVL